MLVDPHIYRRMQIPRPIHFTSLVYQQRGSINDDRTKYFYHSGPRICKETGVESSLIVRKKGDELLLITHRQGLDNLLECLAQQG